MSTAKRILLISSDILPFPGLPTTGAGLRAWSLGKGLEHYGHSVHYSMPSRSLQSEWKEQIPEDVAAIAWEVGSIQPILDRVQPDVLIVCNWPVLAMIPDRLEMPVVLDQHGPHLLERHFQQYGNVANNIRDKLHAFSKADFFTCAGSQQMLYFYPWLVQAGFDISANAYAFIPISLSPEIQEHSTAKNDETTFVYGGVFLPWQNPTLSLSILVEEMERSGRGRLLFFGGKHPLYPVDTGVFESLKAQLEKSSHVYFQPMRPRDEIVEIYAHADVAIDLMDRNPERELAFTTRTVEYLWCGLPVIYNNYAELAPLIREYNAGWALDPQNKDAIREVIRSILEDPQQLKVCGRNAHTLVNEKLTWDRTITPLENFVRNPIYRPNRHARFRSENPEPSIASKSLGQLVDEAVYHYRQRGVSGLLQESYGFAKRRIKGM